MRRRCSSLASAEQGLTGALGRLIVVSEAYPDLKANQNMMQLSEELTSTENKIAFARQAYNDSVMSYNNRREVFPSSVVAGMFNFVPAALLEITEPAKREAPKVLLLNFFERQDSARRQSKRLIVLFGLAVFAIVAAVDLVVLFVFGASGEDGSVAGLLFGTSLVTLAIIGCASLFRTASLRTGGAAVAQQFGATAVAEDTTDFNLRRLRNVVEEIAIASGVPVPQIFVLEQESAINAFAAGYAPSDAAITVTRGALNRLNRDELQGVIAHEFSHVLNGDMRLNIRLVGLLFGILVLAIIGRADPGQQPLQPVEGRRSAGGHCARPAGHRLPGPVLRSPDQGRRQSRSASTWPMHRRCSSPGRAGASPAR